MDIDRLRGFLLVASHGSITRAAKELGLNKSYIYRPAQKHCSAVQALGRFLKRKSAEE